MYYAFQQQNENSAVVFSEYCETLEELKEIISLAPFPVLFTYNTENKQIDILKPFYTIDQCKLIINSSVK